jgi:iron(II)-dependent oxidoreductase
VTLSSLLRNPFRSRASVPLVGNSGGQSDWSDIPSDVRRLIRERRYFRVLAPQGGVQFDDNSLCYAWQAVEQQMALVPEGTVMLRHQVLADATAPVALQSDHVQATPVSAFYLDKTPVTNADYLRFVEAGCYMHAELWPEEILPTVLQFVDQTDQAGPRYWKHGQPDKGKLDHPVVGVCWYEANAYAQWSGKQLPGPAQWQRAGTWMHSNGNSAESHYPWGNSFDSDKANVWASGHHQTVPVNEFAKGKTLNGVYQLIGNVWEWINAEYVIHGINGVDVEMPVPMGEVRGGAFDTYFHTQATCQFRTGKSLTHRGLNVGFRCGRSLDGLLPKPELANEDD